MKKDLIVKCPTCSKEFYYITSASRPFCREKCKMVDLGQWFEEAYSVPGHDNTVYIENEDMLKGLNTDDF